MTTRPIRLLRRGQTLRFDGVPPDRTLLDLLREDLHCKAVKEGCGEGDCGACTVVLAQAEGGGLRYRAINSCIRLAHSVDGMALWTAEDIASPDGQLHPAQQALLDGHGSQCGFCTPGFVMSLFGMYQNRVCRGEAVTRESAVADLSGNLCRCTGYRPIVDAAMQMASLPPARIDEPALLARLQALAAEPGAGDGEYQAPDTLAELLAERAANPDALVVAGCTDVGLWITKQHKRYARVLDVTRAAELRRIEQRPDGALALGAAVTLEDAFSAIAGVRPALRGFFQRFAGLPVRQSGTLGGNVANGSPIGDSMPVLMALGARLVLASRARGERALPVEDFYTGYRQNRLAADELLVRIELPPPLPGEFVRAYKVSKRLEDDISAVCLALRLRLDADARVAEIAIGAGGVAATPMRARQTEQALTGRPWGLESLRGAREALRGEFQPISDMRASSGYRRQVLGNLLERFWHEQQGGTLVSLGDLAGEPR